MVGEDFIIYQFIPFSSSAMKIQMCVGCLDSAASFSICDPILMIHVLSWNMWATIRVGK